ncbi:MAG: hypothetical protein LBL90_10340 [Prevotellaceae bacterium]|nr:hypothetical protein [Prevotellaceae bacterium]
METISVQQFTGEAITPIPTVHLEDVELFFVKDFTLAYNIQRGVAEMSVVGKGNYAGKKMSSFISSKCKRPVSGLDREKV